MKPAFLNEERLRSLVNDQKFFQLIKEYSIYFNPNSRISTDAEVDPKYDLV